MSTGARLAPVITLCLLLCATSGGCASGLRLSLLAAAAEPPSRVALFFSVDAPGARTSRGRRAAIPIANLQASDFRIYEDGALVSDADSQQTIARPELAVEHYTLLLIDMSSSTVLGDQLGAIRAAAQGWVTQLRTQQHVAVYAFDGSKSLYEIVPFDSERASLDKLRTFEVVDPSTNLNGAVLLALSELDKTLQTHTMPVRLGSLVVLTDGVDRANRVSQRQMLDAVDAAPYHVYALGIGRELDDSVLARVGKSGYVRVEDSSSARVAFRELAQLITTASRRFYLLRYCSPSRGGTHSVRVEVSVPAGSGQLQYDLDASRFSAGCDAQAVTAPPSLRRIR